MPTPQETHQQVITLKMQLNEQIIKPIAIKPILMPSLLNVPPPKPIIQPKPNSETQDLIVVKQPILPNSSTPPTITPTNNTLLYFIIGAVVVGFVILKNKDIV